MNYPPRLHLVHHLLDAMPPGRWFSARDLADLLYRDRGGAHRQQKKEVARWLDLYTRTPLLDLDDNLAKCRLYRKPPPDETPEWSDDARATLAAIKRHANRAMSDDAQRARYGLIEAVREFAEIEFNPRCYLESGYRLSRPLYPPGCEPIKPPEPVRIMPDMLAEHEEDAWRLRTNPWHGPAG